MIFNLWSYMFHFLDKH